MTTAIIEKVQKLLALSKSSNANEAAAAANAANKLIDTYRLSEADLECMADAGEPIEEDSEYIYESGKVTPWKTALVSHLVKHYGCVHWNDTSYATGRQVSRYRLVGRRSDIGITKYMFAYLSAECQRLAAIEAKGKVSKMAKRTETVTLEESDIQEAIAQWMKNKYGGKRFVISLVINTHTSGYGMSEMDAHTVVARATREVD